MHQNGQKTRHYSAREMNETSANTFRYIFIRHNNHKLKNVAIALHCNLKSARFDYDLLYATHGSVQIVCGIVVVGLRRLSYR